MLGDIQERKASYYFHLIDEDGNGLIEASDFALRAQRLAESQNLTGEREREILREQVVTWWEHICTIADFDGDARVSFPEWTTYWRSIQQGAKHAEPETLRTLERAARSTLQAIDRDGTGLVTEAEYADWLAAWGAQGSTEAFRQLDRGEKGFLTEADLIVAVQEFYLSDNPAAPGNALYGPLPETS
jgi:Ca2+-binding EF-hand superfamily protein